MDAQVFMLEHPIDLNLVGGLLSADHAPQNPSSRKVIKQFWRRTYGTLLWLTNSRNNEANGGGRQA